MTTPSISNTLGSETAGSEPNLQPNFLRSSVIVTKRPEAPSPSSTVPTTRCVHVRPSSTALLI